MSVAWRQAENCGVRQANASEKAINERLQKAIEEENYEYAKLCQEELKRRKEGGA